MKTKTLLLAVFACLFSTSLFSQDFISIDVEMPEEFQFGTYAPFAYYALALDDGDFIFTQSIYDFDKQKDCGVRFIKTSPQGNITKSIFYEFKIEGSADYPHNCLIKNPYNENEFIFTTQIQISPQFFGWCCSFGDKLKVVAPDSIVNELEDYVYDLFQMYTKI